MLPQITSKSTVHWMKREGYYKRWLTPLHVLNAWMKYYKNSPLGNCPEFMSLENSLFSNLQQNLSLYCAMTMHLPDIDQRNYSMATPKTIVRSIESIWCRDSGNVPPLSRLTAYIDRAIDTFGIINTDKEQLVEGPAKRSGH